LLRFLSPLAPAMLARIRYGMAKLIFAALFTAALPVQGQDPAMTAMAMGMAGQVMNQIADKAEETMKEKMAQGDPMPCIGPHCCQQSSCMNLPGLGCSRDRGPSKCVGASTFPPVQGMCACLAGACSVDGKCSSVGLPQTFGPSPASAVASVPEFSADTVASSSSSSSPSPSPYFSAASSADDFSRWHTTADYSQLFEKSSSASSSAGPVPPENLLAAATVMGAAGLSLIVGFSALVVRLRRSSRQERSNATDEETALVNLEENGVCWE